MQENPSPRFDSEMWELCEEPLSDSKLQSLEDLVDLAINIEPDGHDSTRLIGMHLHLAKYRTINNSKTQHLSTLQER